jgi:hypothetical protein
MKALCLIAICIASALSIIGCSDQSRKDLAKGSPSGTAAPNSNPTSANKSPASLAGINFYEMSPKDEAWVTKSITTYHLAEQEAIAGITISIINFPSIEKLGEWCPAQGAGCAMACELDMPGGDRECINYLTKERLNTQYIIALHDIKHDDGQYQTIAHELGHILDHAYVIEAERVKLLEALNENGAGCFADEVGDCIADHEVLADQISRCAGEEYLGEKTPLEWSHYLVRDLNKGKFCQIFYNSPKTRT